MTTFILLSAQGQSWPVPIDQSFTYDALNRITAAGSNNYSYDAAGNLLVITAIAAPLVVIEQPAGMGLTDNVSSISFGSVNVGSSSSAFTFTIKNSGTADLTGLSVTKDGSHSGDFAINTTGMLGAVPVGSSTTTFTVTFTPSASGARTAALHIASNDAPRSPFDIALTGAGQQCALETWRQTHFATTANTGNAADTADPDKDGIQNLAEFAFGLNPNQNSAGLLPRPQLTGGNLSVTFTKPAGVTGVGYDAETSTTLLPGSWVPATNTGVFPAFQFSVPVGSAPRMFMRLKVTALLPPPPPPPLTPP